MDELIITEYPSELLLAHGIIPTNLKYTIGINEAAKYYGIGTKKLRQIVAENPHEDFFIEIGSHVLLKRKRFEEYLDRVSSL